MVISVKKSRIILLIVSSILVISLIVFDILYFKTKSKISFKDSITINVGNIVPTISDYTNGKSFGDISWDNIKLDKNNKVYYTGEYTGKFTYNDKTYKVSLKVQDKEQPKIEGVKDLEITVGEEIDFVAENKYLYSAVYNAAYMVPEIVLTVVVAVLLLKLPQTKKLLLVSEEQ